MYFPLRRFTSLLFRVLRFLVRRTNKSARHTITRGSSLLRTIKDDRARPPPLTSLVDGILSRRVNNFDFLNMSRVSVIMLLGTTKTTQRAVNVRCGGGVTLLMTLVITRGVRRLITNHFRAILYGNIRLVPHGSSVMSIRRRVFKRSFPLLNVGVQTFPLLRQTRYHRQIPFSKTVNTLRSFRRLDVLFRYYTMDHYLTLKRNLHLLLQAFTFSPTTIRVRITTRLVPERRGTHTVNARRQVYQIIGIILQLMTRDFGSLHHVITKPMTIRHRNRISPTPNVTRRLRKMTTRNNRQYGANRRDDLFPTF